MSINQIRLEGVQGALSRTLDFACLAGAFATTSGIASHLSRRNLFKWPEPTPSDIAGWPAQYVVLLLSTVIAWNAVSEYLRLHKTQRLDTSGKHFSTLIGAGLLWTAATALAIFLFKLQEVSRFFVLSYIVLAGTLIVLLDLGERVAARRIYQSKGLRRTAVVIGNDTHARWLRNFLLDNYCPSPFTLIRQVDLVDDDHRDQNATVKGNTQSATPHDFDEVFVPAAALASNTSALLPHLFERGSRIHIVPGIFDASVFRVEPGNLGGIPVITLRSGAVTGFEAALKRAFDSLVAAMLLLIAAPLMAIIAVLVKLSSPGPVLFRQERVGKGGRRINIYKFRTMHREAERILLSDPLLYQKYVKSNYKLPKGEDPRITSIGYFLRKLSLDEIPQLINVLKGEMSLVGPRPVVPAELEQYGEFASLLLSVQPGLTGRWQVSGRSDIADYTRRVRIDMEYIRDQSIAKDLHILFRTVPVLLSREGAH
jgi:exopolysaccharide biosynthesis polyprenyl glycosylphosphotransferase